MPSGRPTDARVARCANLTDIRGKPEQRRTWILVELIVKSSACISAGIGIALRRAIRQRLSLDRVLLRGGRRGQPSRHRLGAPGGVPDLEITWLIVARVDLSFAVPRESLRSPAVQQSSGQVATREALRDVPQASWRPSEGATPQSSKKAALAAIRLDRPAPACDLPAQVTAAEGLGVEGL